MSHPVNTVRPSSRGERSASAPREHEAANGATTAPRSGESPARPKGSPYREEGGWRHAAIFAAGLAVGALLGAGTALLTAPQTGVETRIALKRRARTARVQAEDRFDELGRELRMAARRSRRTLGRKMTKSRWRAADAFEA
jgi:hypothetical protein